MLERAQEVTRNGKIHLRRYQKGRKVSDDAMKTPFHSEWNYSISPRG